MIYHFTLRNIPEERRSQYWMYVKKESRKMWTGFVWLMIGFSGGKYEGINGNWNSLIDLNISWPPEWLTISYGGWIVLPGVKPNSTSWRFDFVLFLIINRFSSSCVHKHAGMIYLWITAKQYFWNLQPRTEKWGIDYVKL
jgi:hypothetical protein